MNIVYFQNDLRLHDNDGIRLAERLDEPWIGVIIEPARYHDEQLGVQRTTQRRRNAYRAAAQHFKDAAEQRGATIHCRQGDPATILNDYIDATQANNIIYAVEPGTEEQTIYHELSDKPDHHAHYTTWLWNPEDCTTSWDRASNTFTSFKQYLENNHGVREPLKTPEDLHGGTTPPHGAPMADAEPVNHDEDSLIPFTPDEQTGLERLNYYCEEGLPKQYKYTRNKSLGVDNSTKFSIFLAHGSLSPRRIYHAIEAFEDEHGSSKSTYWVKFELTWRDFYRYQAMKHGPALYAQGGIQAQSIPWQHDSTMIQRFEDGQTGYPFVDAAMRELQRTGYMSNRARQNAASFFANNLHQDWRIGAAIFEKYLVDYDPASNYGNWQYAIGIGNDSRSQKYFNITKQAKKYDAAEYIKTWVEELQGLQDKHVYEPWTMTEGEQAMYDFQYGEDYPERVVDFRATINQTKPWFD